MKWFFYIVIILIWLEGALSVPDNCAHNETSTKINCNFTEYESYVKCIRQRMKRQINCEDENSFSSSGSTDDCLDCDCTYCNQNNNCNSPCNTCCAPCKTRSCCHKTCNAQCTSGTCRKSCRKSCTGKIAANGKPAHTNTTSHHMHNTTTVINLKNVINNTVVIPPIYINHTSFNNATVGTPEILQPTITNSTLHKCCQIITPRQCLPSNQFPFVKCYHYGKHTCGSICQSTIMHAQPHQICEERPSGPPNCHKQTIYIPQPQPKCIPIPTWPYLSCGIKQTCDGCYPGARHCPQLCYNAGPWFGSSGSASGFSWPGGYPAFLGLPENQFAFTLTENQETLPELPSSKYNSSLSAFGDDEIKVEVTQPINPNGLLDDVPHTVNIETIKSSEHGKSDAVVIVNDEH